ncbi:MAG: hypothetical protein M1812_006411 [Candelaria pacifica]|nr:MAG: hypothetical protein M1812_006411 [Candelaria pacifica]
MDESNGTNRKRSHEEIFKPPGPTSTNDMTHKRTSSTTAIDGETSSSSPKRFPSQTPASTNVSDGNENDTTPLHEEHNNGAAKDGPATEGEKASDNPKSPLENLDWEDLEERFRNAMASKEREEWAIHEDFNRQMALYMIWSQEGQAHESDRAIKRLKTRMSYVQGSEERLRQRTDHYQNVVKAFESALALLTGAS